MDDAERVECHHGELRCPIPRTLPDPRPRWEILPRISALVDDAGVTRVMLPQQSPSVDAYAEWLVRSVK